ncbi:beta galactosidase jelly roll domain-containing protein [Neobacillus sp. WH10]|uniref:beta-mannosidase n=1 Tax=Neobacillus sp. WH10 TaxID=3047873 RepID=UPI0024C1CB55|nr:sugar-binding domain-containing protein [Neobacillus sp. WH10]WHY77054.1 beta galactosidase jelly roll domain-containing protein [Neobacillus sp. WH10]
MKLNDNWKIRDFGVGTARDLEVASPEYVDYFWMTASVPGDVHSTLIKRKLIDDPFYGHNDLKCQWVEEKVWWYRSTFDFDEELLKEDRYELIFEGLDTFATVYLNGVELGSTENMFISHTFEVTRELKKGKNTIAVKFDPVHVHAKEKVQYYWSGFSKKRIWTRKAQSHYGWDWGPRLVAAGIWKDVHLEKRTFAKIDHLFAKTISISPEQAVVEVDIEIEKYWKEKEYVAQVSLAYKEDVISAKVKMNEKKAAVVLEVADPKLWWTHDLGTPHLYQLRIELFTDGVKIDERFEEFGIRTMEVRLVDEVGKHSFTFVLNGHKLFAKGANWIPIDSFIGAVPDSRYKHLIKMSKDANMNMLRVWGGGIYEKDVFYEECNRLGILVWQDFMFACALYPDYNKNFMANVREEITHVVKRLRNHPCLSLWCGNNENDWLYEALSSSGEITHPFYGERIYHELMPELLEELDPTRLFWPSSPFGGNDHNSREQGDTHNWQVWHGNIEPRVFGEPQKVDYSIEGLSFKNFKNDHTLFASEFGMHASSNRYTLEFNIPKDQFFWGSEEMAYRNKDIHQPKGILLMEGYTGVPKDLEEYISFSMLTQAEGLKYGIEHYRRNKPHTSGALFWQLNDCWPGTSWSVIDYYLLPKASYHYARKFYHPILLTLDHAPGKDIGIWVVNDRLESYQDEIELAVYKFTGERVFSKQWTILVEANVTKQIDVVLEDEVLGGLSPKESVMVIRSKGHKTDENLYYFCDHKDLNWGKAELTISLDRENDELTITTNVLARMVTIELGMEQLVIEDNFFDLLPKGRKTVKVQQAQGKEVPWESLRVKAINSVNTIVSEGRC